MADRATPNLPSRDFAVTARFFGMLGFQESYRSDGWMILYRGGITLEFFPYPNLDPASSSFGACLRLDDVDVFHALCMAAGVPDQRTGWPRVHPPVREGWGGRVGALIDPDGSLLRLVQE